MRFELIKFFRKDLVYRNGKFDTLGTFSSEIKGTLGYADGEKYLKKLLDNPAISCIITSNLLAASVPNNLGVIVSESPRDEFYILHNKFIIRNLYKKFVGGGIGVGCFIDKSACISENVILGDRVIVGAGVIIGSGVKIGSDVFLEPGVMIGVEGILFMRKEEHIIRIPLAGSVEIADGSTILAGSVIVRSVHPCYPTRIGKRSIIGIGATIGHEAQIGDDCIVSGRCIVARSTVLKKGSFLGPGAIAIENLLIGENAKVRSGSVVIRNVPNSGDVSGNFAKSHLKNMMEQAKTY